MFWCIQGVLLQTRSECLPEMVDLKCKHTQTGTSAHTHNPATAGGSTKWRGHAASALITLTNTQKKPESVIQLRFQSKRKSPQSYIRPMWEKTSLQGSFFFIWYRQLKWSAAMREAISRVPGHGHTSGASAFPAAEVFYVMATPPRSNECDELRLTSRLLEQMKTTCGTVMWPLTAAVLLFTT